MRLEVGVVRQGRLKARLHVAGMDDAPASDAEELLHCPPEPLNDGDGAVPTERSEALADAEGSQVCAKRGCCKLRPLVRLEMPRPSVAEDRRVEESGSVLRSGLAPEQARREGHAGADVKDHGEETREDPQEAGDLGQVGHPHVVWAARRHDAAGGSGRGQRPVSRLAAAPFPCRP
jgi:hypothetical protein